MNRYLLLLLSILIISCGEYSDEGTEWEYEERIVAAKRDYIQPETFTSSGGMVFLIAFTNGTNDRVSFGEYTCINIGDTLTYAKRKGGYYYYLKLNCE